MDLSIFKNLEETYVNSTAYLGMAISCPRTETEGKGTIQASAYGKKMSQDRTYQQVHTEDSHTGISSLNSVTWETMPTLSPVPRARIECDINITFPEQTMPVLSPVTERFQTNRDVTFCPILNSTSFDSDNTSFATARSKTYSTDMYFSSFDINQSEALEEKGSKDNNNICEGFCEALGTHFINTDLESLESEEETENEHGVRRDTGADWTIDENHALKMKLRKTNNLSNQRRNTVRQNTCIPRTVLRNIFGTKSNISERMSKADLYDKTANEVEPLSQKMTKANFSVLDMRKYIIPKENITDKKIETKHLDTECFDCVSFRTNAHPQTQPEAVSPEAVSSEALPRHPLESYFEQRHVSANKHLKRLFFCGCMVGKTKSSEKYRKTTKNKMKTRTRLSLGLSLKF